MIKAEVWGILLITLLVSCGIPSFEYIADPIEVSSSDTSFEVEIDIETSPEINSFDIYSRYFVTNDSEDLFDDLSLSDIDDGVENFLADNGFYIVKYHNEYSDSVDEDFEQELIDTVVLPVTDENINFTVTLDDDEYSRYLVKLTSDSLDTDYYLWSTAADTNFIGEIAEDKINDLQEQILEDSEEVYEGDDINLEFVVVNYGIGSTSLSSIESLPVLIENEFEIRN